MNINTVHTLSGSTVFSESVDSGWQVSFYGAAGQLLETQDSRRSIKRVEYDGYLRVQAIFEQAVDQSMRASERFEYAGNDDSTHAHNRAGQLWRHDDTAGSCWLEDYSLGGDVMNQQLRFLVSLEPPDWPVAQSDRDGLLEAGPGFVTSSRFSGSGESVEQTDAAGNKRRYTLTVDGALKSVWLQLSGGSEQVLADNIDYSASGQVLTETAGNAVVTLNRYDEQTGLLSQTRSVRSDGSPLQNLSYEYDPHANIVRMIDGLTLRRIPRRQVLDDACNYEYDTLYQLIRATGTEVNSLACGPELPGFQSPVDPNDRVSYTRTFEYDAAGNLQKMAHVGGNSFTRQMVIAPYSNRSLPDDEPCPGPEHFDPRGNLLILQPGQAMEWDVRNQLARVASVVREEGEDDQEQYAYDGGGQRVRKICTRHASQVVHRDETRYLPGLEIRTHSATGESLHIISVQAAGFGVRVLHWLQGKPSDISQDQLRYSLSDHGGSSTQELDDQGQLISQEGYYPFGGTCWWAGRNATEANYKTIRYSAKERDATGLYYYGYRYYAPWLFRWINPDPAGIVDGLNGYGFVHNNPLNLYDEDGLIGKHWAVIQGELAPGRGHVLRAKHNDYKWERAVDSRWELNPFARKGVHYYSPETRSQTAVTAAKGRLRWAELGQLVHSTGETITTGSRNWHSHQLGYVLGLNETGSKELHVFKHVIGKIHHSSPFAGAPVLDAGMMTISMGKVAYIENKSGHYRPRMEQKLHTLRFLERAGFDLAEIYISDLFNYDRASVDAPFLEADYGRVASSAQDFYDFHMKVDHRITKYENKIQSLKERAKAKNRPEPSFRKMAGLKTLSDMDFIRQGGAVRVLTTRNWLKVDSAGRAGRHPQFR